MEQSAEQAVSAQSARLRLREFRTSKKLSVAVFAKELGCAPSLLWRIERGKGNPGLRTAMAIQEKTGIPMAEWLEGDHAA